MLGFIARSDNSGLGIESWDFCEHMQPDKVLVAVHNVLSNHFERFARYPDVRLAKQHLTSQEIDDFLEGLTTLFAIETPYDWRLISEARKRGVKTVLRFNFEFLPDPLPVVPDVLISPVEWLHPPECLVIPFPINRARFPFKRRERATRFLHVAGRQGINGRNGTRELLAAIPLVKEDVSFTIYSQLPLEDVPIDRRIRLHIGDARDNSDFYQSADMMVFPRRFGGQALSLNEALSSGIPTLMPNLEPQNTFLPAELLIPCESHSSFQLLREIPIATISPQAVATKISEWANRDISGLSLWADKYAQSISWESLKSRYDAILR